MSSRHRTTDRNRAQQSQRQADARTKQRATQRNVLFLIVGAVVVLAAVLAVVFTQGGDDGEPANAGNGTAVPQTRPVTVSGDALPRYDAAATPDPAIGAAIPTVTGISFDGAPVAIADNGKAKVLLFVADWCPHCRDEVPLLAPDLRESPLPADVEMIAVSTGVNPSAPNYPPSEWLADEGWPTPVLVDDEQGTAAAAYGLSAYPYFVFVDSQNKVVSRVTGEIPLEEFHTRVDAIST